MQNSQQSEGCTHQEGKYGLSETESGINAHLDNARSKGQLRGAKRIVGVIYIKSLRLVPFSASQISVKDSLEKAQETHSSCHQTNLHTAIDQSTGKERKTKWYINRTKGQLHPA